MPRFICCVEIEFSVFLSYQLYISTPIKRITVCTHFSKNNLKYPFARILQTDSIMNRNFFRWVSKSNKIQCQQHILLVKDTFWLRKFNSNTMAHHILTFKFLSGAIRNGIVYKHVNQFTKFKCYEIHINVILDADGIFKII